MSKKSMVLTGKENQKAVLTIEEQGNDLVGRLRLYNFSNEPSGIISLGLYNDGKVIKAGLTRQSSMLWTFQALNEKLPNKFSCAVVNILGGESEALLYGNSEGSGNKDDVYGAVISSLENVKSMTEVEKVLDLHGIDYDEQTQKEIDEAIDEEFEGKTCAKCKYREYFYSHCKASGLQEESQEKQDKLTFYQEIKAQIDKLFEKNPQEEYLENLLPNSKFVKVELEGGGDYYVFGLIYDEDKLKYICYGVPGVYQKNPPKELSGYPVWFPLDKTKTDGFGYWLTYQDAESGESIKAVVE